MSQAVAEDIIELNLAAVDTHFRLESVDADGALALYTDDVVWESPARGVVCVGKREVADNHRRMFASMSDIDIEPLDRFATEDRVVDDALVRFTLAGGGVDNAPLPAGSRVEMRLVHVFEMREGMIARERVFEMWRRG